MSANPSSPHTSTQTPLPSAVRLMARFNAAFSVMALIPILTFLYLLTIGSVSVSPFTGMSGLYVVLALIIAALGFVLAHELIQHIIRRLVDTNQRLQRLNDQQAAFVSNVAHELRAPLTVFKGALDNLADGLYGPVAPDQQQPVAMCQREVGRLKRLVTDLLDISRIEAGKLPMAKQPVVLQEVLRASVQLFEGALKERGLQLSVDFPGAPALVTGDPERLEQVFVNLLSNAAKFTGRGGVSVRLREESGTVRVEVEDTGPGIAAADLGRIFDKFERVGEHEEGSGLGLPIARDIIELHHGHLWAESEPGQGSRFIVALPAAGSAPAQAV